MRSIEGRVRGGAHSLRARLEQAFGQPLAACWQIFGIGMPLNQSS